MANLPELWRKNTWASPFRDLQRQIDRLFDDFNMPDAGFETSTFSDPAFLPTCEVEETDSHYLMSFDLPGVQKENIRINLQDHQLVVSGERKEESEKKGKNRMRSERTYGSFMRSFTLPSTVKADAIEAHYSDGVLRLAIPKSEATKPQQIKIGEEKAGFWDKFRKAIPIQGKDSAA